MLPDSKIYVAGHRGLVGSALVRALRKSGFVNIVSRTHAELDLCNQQAVRDFFAAEKPDYVFLAAAKVGGIHANDTYPADFIRDNLLIQSNVIDAASSSHCKKLLFLGSSCIYPKLCPQPIKEEYLLTGALETTNESYAVAKIAGIAMCQAYRRQFSFDAISVMPTNLYGPGDNYHPENSHVIPALIRRFHNAQKAGDAEVSIWGSGKALREFLHVDDMASACLMLMATYSGAMQINVGSQQEYSILDTARLIADVVGFTGTITTDTSKPDGTPRKLLDSSRLFAMGWQPHYQFKAGLQHTYQDYLATHGQN